MTTKKTTRSNVTQTIDGTTKKGLSPKQWKKETDIGKMKNKIKKGTSSKKSLREPKQ